jgi:hypothetical protein
MNLYLFKLIILKYIIIMNNNYRIADTVKTKKDL